MAEYTLHYFDVPGAAEPIRLAFAVSGIPFKDRRIPFAEFPAIKSEFPLGQVPVLELKDGTMITQGYAILRYVGSLNPSAGLYPQSDLMKRLRIDELMDMVKDTHVKLAATMKMDEEMKMKTRKALAEEEIPFVFGKLDEMIGDKKFATGDEMTIADLLLTNMMEVFTSGYIDGFPATLCDPYTNLQRVKSNLYADPRVVQWKEKREVGASS